MYEYRNLSCSAHPAQPRPLYCRKLLLWSTMCRNGPAAAQLGSRFASTSARVLAHVDGVGSLKLQPIACGTNLSESSAAWHAHVDAHETMQEMAAYIRRFAL